MRRAAALIEEGGGVDGLGLCAKPERRKEGEGGGCAKLKCIVWVDWDEKKDEDEGEGTDSCKSCSSSSSFGIE